MLTETPSVKDQIVSLLERAFCFGDQTWQGEIHELAGRFQGQLHDPELEILIECSFLYWKQKYEDCYSLISSYFGSDMEKLTSRYRALIVMIFFKSCFRLHKYQEGLEILDTALKAFRDISMVEKMSLLWSKGNLLVAIRQLSDALVCLRDAENLATDLGIESVIAMINVDMAVVVLETGDYARAVLMYESSLAVLSEDTRYEQVCILIRLNIASAYPQLRRDEDALSMYRNLLEYPAVTTDPRYNIPVHVNMAISHKRLGQYQESQKEYEIVLDLAGVAKNIELQLRAHLGLADLYQKINDPEQARANATQAVYLSELLNIDSLRYQANASLAGIEYEEGDRLIGIDRLAGSFQWMVDNSNALNALEYGGILVGWCSGENRFEDAFRFQKICAQIRSSMYAREVERTVELTAVRSRLDHERESIRMRDEERNRILNAVLPPSIAERLMNGERHIADRLPEVTIMFADIVGFTKMSSSMAAGDVVLLLEDLFKGMDEICSVFGCERLKTIGDSYMAICGASEPFPDHVERMCKAALTIGSNGNKLPLDHTRLRIGIHTGPVIAGVMNGIRLSFDVWGDTVNVAARMEGHSSPGKVVCSQAVVDAMAKDDGVTFEKTKPLDIKGKGRIETYMLLNT
ncbi:MAG: tetratricopeptide repeat protein [Candidatus Kapabacteria bacterium]|nr:tetratricopeptide repeat protein [Candidatus Kapabacteria bacterium]